MKDEELLQRDLIDSKSRDVIGPDSRVKMHFSIRMARGDQAGEKIDGTKPDTPAVFSMGDGSLLQGFEEVLLGLKVGDEREFLIRAAQGFGARNPMNIRTLARSRFAQDIELENGLMVSFEGPGGELPGVVQRVSAETVTVDFNHPLSGRDVVFAVEIVDIG